MNRPDGTSSRPFAQPADNNPSSLDPSSLTPPDPSSLTPPDFQRLVRVEEHDLDRWGAAIPAMYARWMEETEYGFLRSRDLSVSLTDERGRYGFPRTRVELQIESAAQRGDQLRVSLWLGKTDGKRLNYRFKIERQPELKSLDTSPNHWEPSPNHWEPSPHLWEPSPNHWEICATGRFVMACARFPAESMPYAIPIPERVLEQLGLSPE